MNAILRAVSGMALAAMLLAQGVVQAQVPAGERQALIDLYHATGGDLWHRNDGWLGPPGTECQWFGVLCNTSWFVEKFSLFENNLSGPLPDVLSEFPHLNALRLYGNSLTGPVPAQYIVPFPADDRPFWIVDLSDNALSGSLPEITAGFTGDIAISLSGNQLSGQLPASWAGLNGLWALRLDGNEFSTGIPVEWSNLDGLRVLSLSGIGLQGPIPDALSSMTALEMLDLSGNALEGELPGWFSGLNLRELLLRGNRLEGSIESAIAAMSNDLVKKRLDLSDNRFTGVIPEELADLFGFDPANGFGLVLLPPGLNLCWNDLEVPSARVAAFVDEFHAGGGVNGCLGRERFALDRTISGSWYDPFRSGEGIVQQLLADGRILFYWFGFDPRASEHAIPEGSQFWAFETPVTGDSGFEVDQIIVPVDGRFGQGNPEIHVRYTDFGRIEIHRVGTQNQNVAFDYSLADLPVVGLPQVRNISFRVDQSQLTRLAGTTCDNRQSHEWISGAWYDPERNGEGFIVEVTEDGRAVVYWFTYQPGDTGLQAWMTGVGEVEAVPQLTVTPPAQPVALIHIDNLVQPVGGVFGPDFDPDEIDRMFWGTLMMEFYIDGTGHVFWDSVFEDYGSGDYPLTRLARPLLAECPDA